MTKRRENRLPRFGHFLLRFTLSSDLIIPSDLSLQQEVPDALKAGLGNPNRLYAFVSYIRYGNSLSCLLKKSPCVFYVDLGLGGTYQSRVKSIHRLVYWTLLAVPKRVPFFLNSLTVQFKLKAWQA
ncbi:hypothetical protein PILCRDRAFT_810900 [Piloderma croceum F 1598]|uniref:Uncharacterized protein n=1 Tax=Piloderma croceum (strain F 1598) TaxID=765440 RepID=A0A0C3GJ11_PILCF|nr:hypothetical protein PILCRDRAFT_810900 [Piloderma croceum F 1598]